MDNTIDPNNAAQKFSTINPGTILDTNKNKKPLIIKVNSPKVNKLIGRVNIINIGLIKTLTIPIANMAHNADINPAMLIPGTTQATKSNENANNIHLISM